MSVFPGFGGWINQNMQQPLKAESKRHENVKSNSDTNNPEPWYEDPDEDPESKAAAKKHGDVKSRTLYSVDPKYFDLAELKRQARVWTNANNKQPWYDAPAKVKTKNGLCHLNIEFTLGLFPQGAYEMLTNPRNISFFSPFDNDHSSQRLENKSTKVLKKDGPRQITKVGKALRWKLLWWSGTIPIHLIIDENHQNLTAKYKKEKMMYMKVLEGSWKVEPLYIDADRLCKHIDPKNQQEYKKCSGGQGRIASKVTMEEIFEPSPLLNLPPVSWIMRAIVIKTTKILLEDLRHFVIDDMKNS
ncbi:uncharacterized protein LOC18014677 [Eutrema salsugineum]|uniref:uncharacterized protein LOC18014677 n=1 Tax=Eutrema salsugineum TaxID=72664 RepID=UPI000CED6EED|nr:uncharacterized protein LOC18014677 [Eutrema salsugineum]